MNLAPEGPMAIPCWVNGRAFLTVTEQFFDVIEPATGEAIRRVPLCGADEAAAAVTAAQEASASWAARPAAERAQLLTALADALAGYSEHFAKLLRQETALDEAAALAEVATAVAALRSPAADTVTGVVALIADAGQPLAGVARELAGLTLGGATLVVKPSPKVPGAIFALCELTSRAAWPAGVVNVLQGDEAAIAGLCAAPVAEVRFVGGAELASKVGQMAQAQGKGFVAKAG